MNDDLFVDCNGFQHIRICSIVFRWLYHDMPSLTSNTHECILRYSHPNNIAVNVIKYQTTINLKKLLSHHRVLILDILTVLDVSVKEVQWQHMGCLQPSSIYAPFLKAEVKLFVIISTASLLSHQVYFLCSCAEIRAWRRVVLV